MSNVKLYGVSLSPYTRKAMVALYEKSIDYEMVLQLPGDKKPEYLAKHPLGKIPCLQDGDIYVPDSTCILAYLEKRQPKPSLYPDDLSQYAQAVWLEDYMDNALAKVTLTPYFERVLAKAVYKQEPNEEKVAQVLEKNMPKTFDYLEAHISEGGFFLSSGFSVVDITAGALFMSFHYGQEHIDATRWPKLADYVERLLVRDSFQYCADEDNKMLQMLKG